MHKLHHREAAKGKSRRVTTQANPSHYAKDVTRGESPRATMISWSIGIPSHLSLPLSRCLALAVSRDRQRPKVPRRESMAEGRSYCDESTHDGHHRAFRGKHRNC